MSIFIVRQRRARQFYAAMLFVVLLIMSGGCSPAAPVAVDVSSPSPVPAEPTGTAPIDTAAPTGANLIDPTTVPVAPTEEATEVPAASPVPVGTPTAEGGVVPTPVVAIDVDPAATVAPIGNIRQPAYAESECGDKYPCNDDVEAWEKRIGLPKGFEATYYALIDGKPNVLTFGPDGLLYVGTMAGEIFIVDEEGDSDLYVDGFIAPAGLAFQPGTDRLYVSSRVLDQIVDGIAQVAVVEDGAVTELIGNLPCCYVGMHSANGIAFGPDGYGYVSVGGRADHGEILFGNSAGEQDELEPFEASILRFSPDGAIVEVFARGFRNSYDIAWDGDGNLYTTDNMPDYGPPEEFNKVEPGGEHGYPWFDCDVCFKAPDDIEIVPPLHTFVPHSAPTGITAYLDDEFPGYYNSLFATLWSAFPEAQRVVWFGPGGEETATFATGFAAPIDLTVGPDGALYVADWATGIIFRIAYVGEG